MSPKASACISFLLALPMGILLSAIVFEIQPIEMFLKSILTNDGSQPNTFGFGVMIGSLLFLPVALAVSLWPMLLKRADGKRRYYMINLVVAAAVLALMVPTWGALAEEIYRCDVLHIPNCD